MAGMGLERRPVRVMRWLMALESDWLRRLVLVVTFPVLLVANVLMALVATLVLGWRGLSWAVVGLCQSFATRWREPFKAGDDGEGR